MTEATEAETLKLVLQEYTSRGYEVFLHPNQKILPSFMRGYVPDAIAINEDSKIAFEVFRARSGIQAKADRIINLFKEQEEWTIKLVYINPISIEIPIRTASIDSINRSNTSVTKLIEDQAGIAALLQGWATFEAAARMLVPATMSRPQSPIKLVDALAQSGTITPSEADALRSIAKLRNQVAHGDLETDISYDHLITLVNVVKELVKEFSSKGKFVT